MIVRNLRAILLVTQKVGPAIQTLASAYVNLVIGAMPVMKKYANQDATHSTEPVIQLLAGVCVKQVGAVQPVQHLTLLAREQTSLRALQQCVPH